MGNAIMDSDRYFEIDPVSRSITSLNQKGSIVQFDHNSERLTFSIPRYVEGHDMTECTNIEVHYSNIDATTKAENVGVYPITDMQTDPDNEERVICTWLISQNATQKVGLLKFSIRFTCVDENANIAYSWNTGIFSSIVVLASLYNSNEIAKEYVDVLEQWEQELFSLSAEGTKNIAIASADALSEIEQKGEEVKKSIPDDYSSFLAEVSENKADTLILTSETAKNLEISDSKRGSIVKLSVYGESTQSEDASPASPVEVVSVENPTIRIVDADGSDVQEIIIPYTLRGLKNKNNVFEARDEIVVKDNSVKFVQNCAKYAITAATSFASSSSTSSAGYYRQYFTPTPLMKVGTAQVGICNVIPRATQGWNAWSKECVHFGQGNNAISVITEIQYANAQELYNYLSDDGKNEIYVIYQRATPIETDITDTECGKALLKLYTSYPNTSIMCDADLQIEYKADTTNAYKNVKGELDTLKQAIINLGGTI